MKLGYKNKTLILVGLSLLGLAGLVICFLWQGKIIQNQYQRFKSETESRQSEEAEIDYLLQAGKQIKNINTQELDSYLLASKNIIDFLNFLETTTQKYSLELHSRLGQPEAAKILFELTLTGKYPDLFLFLQDLHREKISFQTEALEFKAGEEGNVSLNFKANIPYYVED